MENIDDKISMRVSIPLCRLKNSTVEKLQSNDQNMSKAVNRKSSNEQTPACSVQESDAHLLLGLSNKITIHDTLVQESPKKWNKMGEKGVIVLELDESDEEINKVKMENQKDDDSATMKHKLLISVPLEPVKSPNKIKLYGNDITKTSTLCQTDEIYIVSKDDYDLLAMMKAKGLIRPHLSLLTGPDSEISIVNGTPEDVNNNTEDQSNLEVTSIDLCQDDNEFNLDTELSDKLISHSEQYKAMFAKVVELYQNRDKEKLNSRPVKQSTVSVNVTHIIKEIFANAEDLENTKKISVTLNFDKGTQTPLDILQDAKEESEKKRKEKFRKVVNSTKNERVIKGAAAHQSSYNLKVYDTETVVKTVKMHQVPISPVPGSLPNETQDLQQLLQSRQQHSVNCNTDSYPSTRMMSALELPENLQRINKNHCVMPAAAFTPQQFSECNTHVSMTAQQQRVLQNVNDAASNVAPPAAAFAAHPSSGTNIQAAMIPQQQHFMQNASAAASNATLLAAQYTSQLSPGFSPQASMIAPQQRVFNNMSATASHGALSTAAYTPQQSSSCNTQASLIAETEIRKQRPSRRFKNTPTRSQPYQTNGPQFSTPVQGTNELLLEQQKLRSMVEQQKAWESQLQNYPNTAWGQSFKDKWL